MAHFFCKTDHARTGSRESGESGGNWAVLTLDSAGVRLSPAPRVAKRASANVARATERCVDSCGGSDVLVLRGPDDAWVLLAGPRRGVEINGLPLTEGIRVLAHRDEVRIAGAGSCFFSTETLPAIAAFPGTDSACMRCKLMLTPGKPAVRCPGCTIWHHESAEDGLSCWTGFEACANCGRSTAMDAGFAFSPEDL